jgi:hypothetical protein
MMNGLDSLLAYLGILSTLLKNVSFGSKRQMVMQLGTPR